VKIITIKVNSASDFGGTTADYAVATIGTEAIARIKVLAAVVASLVVYKVVEFDYSCILKEVDYNADADNGKEPLKQSFIDSDCATLNVTDTDFFWSGDYKGGSRWDTDSIPLTVLDELGDFDNREDSL